jgi:uncharacterized protein YdcH (DUF465 family)
MRVSETRGEVSETEARISRLHEEHQLLERRLSELNRHTFLTPTEEMEVAQIKKEKLRRKDLIQLLQARAS